jgi:hypothetical protein
LGHNVLDIDLSGAVVIRTTITYFRVAPPFVFRVRTHNFFPLEKNGRINSQNRAQTVVALGPEARHSPGVGASSTGETFGANHKIATGIYVVNNLLFFISNKDVSLKLSSRDWDSRKAFAWQGIF